jgi:hypothetical protein
MGRQRVEPRELASTPAPASDASRVMPAPDTTRGRRPLCACHASLRRRPALAARRYANYSTCCRAQPHWRVRGMLAAGTLPYSRREAGGMSGFRPNQARGRCGCVLLGAESKRVDRRRDRDRPGTKQPRPRCSLPAHASPGRASVRACNTARSARACAPAGRGPEALRPALRHRSGRAKSRGRWSESGPGGACSRAARRSCR